MIGPSRVVTPSKRDLRAVAPVEPPGYKDGALTFELTRVPERPGWLWEAYLGSTHVEHGWTRTKVGARIAMWDCIWRWRKWPRRG